MMMMMIDDDDDDDDDDYDDDDNNIFFLNYNNTRPSITAVVCTVFRVMRKNPKMNPHGQTPPPQFTPEVKTPQIYPLDQKSPK